MRKRILLTGATGFLGRNLVPLLLKDPDLENLALLSRSSDCPSTLREYSSDRRFRIIPGNIERSGVLSESLPTKDREEIKRETTHIIHAAGLTAFLEEERAQLESMNLNGTQNLINLFNGCPNMENFVYVSTAYSINGGEKKNGKRVLENELYIPNGSGNPYEKTKFDAEMRVRNSGLPFTILRPAIFSGDSITGNTGFDSRAGQGVVYGLMRATAAHPSLGSVDNFFNWLVTNQDQKDPTKFLDVDCRLVGYPHVTKNFMFIDDICGQTNSIFQYMPRGEGKVFHVVSKTSITTEQMLNAMQSALRVRGFHFAGDPADGDWQVERANPIEKIANMMVSRHYAPYFLREEPLWDTTHADKAFSTTGYQRINMSPEKFNWLMEQYVTRELGSIVKKFTAEKEERRRDLKKRNTTSAHDTDFKPEYLEYIKQFGRHSMAYSSIQPGMRYYSLRDAGFIPFVVLPPTKEEDFRAQKFRRRIKDRVESETGMSTPLENISTTHVLADPICNPAKVEELTSSFLKAHPQACFWQVSEPYAQVLKNFGYKVNEFGTEALIDLPYNSSGKLKQNLRTALNRTRDLGFVLAEEESSSFNWQEARDLSKVWVDMKHEKNPEAANQELSFLARPLFYGSEQDVRIFSARNNGVLKGFVVYSPMYREGKVYGYMADVLRHAIDQKYGICDAINLEAFARFQQEGKEVVSLGLSPFSRVEEGDCGDPIINKIFQKTYEDAEANQVYHFKGNALHKSRYCGREIPVYFATREHVPIEQMVGLMRACKAF